MTPRQGSVWRVDIPADVKRGRPVVVVSREDMNRGSDVLIIPTYTSNLSAKRGKPSYVFLPRGTGGLPEDCVAQAAHIHMVEVSELRDEMGVLDIRYMGEIVRALGWMMQADCRLAY